MQRNRLVLLLLFVFVDVLGFSLILPLLPYYAATFAASPGVIGLLIASNAVAQLLGAPVVGRLSDRWGRRPLLIASISFTVVSFVLLGAAWALWVIFASRILDGLLGGNISLAQAYVADITDRESRAKSLGLIGAAFGIGFVIGPALGGTLSIWGYDVPAFAAAGLALLNLIGVALWLPESLTPEQRADRGRRPAFSFGPLVAAFRHPRVGSLLRVRLFYSLAFTTFETIFSLYAAYYLRLSAQTTSYVLAYVGILIAIVQGGAIGWLTSRFSELHLVLAASILMTLSLVGWALVPNLVALLIVLIPLSLASGVLNTLLNSVLTKIVARDEVGGTLGLSASLQSLTRIISPSAGGFLLQGVGAWAPGGVAATIMMGVTIFIWRRWIAGSEISASDLAESDDGVRNPEGGQPG